MKKKIRVIIKGTAGAVKKQNHNTNECYSIDEQIEAERQKATQEKARQRITREALLHYIDFLQEKIGYNEEKIEELENVIDYTEQDIEAARELLDYLKGAGKDAKTL